MNCFDLSELKEFTVEAGRPDSITREKLMMIRRLSDYKDFRKSTDNAAKDTGSGRKKTYR